MVVNRYLCKVLRLIVEVVKECLNSEEEWKKVVVRKNCVFNVSLCDYYNDVVYYCVINIYVNEILEVCVYK